jgi:peptidoglycan hydrolase FlgJ
MVSAAAAPGANLPAPAYRAPADPQAGDLRRLAAAGESPDGAEIHRAARDFEAVFLRMLLGAMLPEEGGGIFGEGPSAGVVRGMFVDQVGDGLAERRALGIADLVERSMKRESAGEPSRQDAVPAPARTNSAGARSVPVDLRA